MIFETIFWDFLIQIVTVQSTSMEFLKKSRRFSRKLIQHEWRHRHLSSETSLITKLSYSLQIAAFNKNGFCFRNQGNLERRVEI